MRRGGSRRLPSLALTVMVKSDASAGREDSHIQALADGIIPVARIDAG